MRWIIDEYFYSYIDSPYYKCNELEQLLKRSGIASRFEEKEQKEGSGEAGEKGNSKENEDHSNSNEQMGNEKNGESKVNEEGPGEKGENQEEQIKKGSDTEAKAEKPKTKMTRGEWNAVRQYIGKPRRFSQAFVNEELNKIQNYRNFTRDAISRKKQMQSFKVAGGNNPSSEELSKSLQIDPEIVNSARSLSGLEVSEYVLAIHPTCNHFHSGTVLTVDGAAVVINFISTDLGVQKVADHHVVSLSNKDPSAPGTQGIGDLSGSLRSSNPFQNFTKDIDFVAMAMLVKMLERKMLLVNELKTFNELGEKNWGSLNEKFFLDYEWTLGQIDRLNAQIKDVAIKFRLRGFGSTSSFGKPSKPIQIHDCGCSLVCWSRRRRKRESESRS